MNARRRAATAKRAAVAWGTRLLNLGPHSLDDTTLICGTPRSGTTWVAQTIAADPGSAVLFEPLHPDNVPLVRQAGFSWMQYVPPGTDWPSGERVLRRIFEGRILNAWTAQEIDRPQRVTTWVVKCVRANRLLPWLSERLPVRTLLVVRHPCAVVASQIAAGWPPPKDPGDSRLDSDFPQIAAVRHSATTPDEIRALRWAIDTLVPLSHAKGRGWAVVTYEQLARGQEAWREVFERWGVPLPLRFGERVAAASSTTLDSSREHDRISGWTKQLDAEQVRQILDVCRPLGLDLYGPDPEPNLERLSEWL